MKSRLTLNAVLFDRSIVLEFVASVDQPLLVRGYAILVFYLGLDVLNGVSRFDDYRDSSTGESRNEKLHTASQSQNQVKGGLFLDVVVTQGTAVLELLASKDQALLVWGDALLVLDLGLYIFDGVRSLNLESDGLASEGLDKDLHADTVTKITTWLLFYYIRVILKIDSSTHLSRIPYRT